MVFNFLQIEPFLQILLAAFLGAIIGLERKYKKKEAGIRTFSLVSFGACFFTVMAVYLSSNQSSFPPFVQVDPGRVIQAIAIGIGFLGSGLIIYHKLQIEGLTTAAALWAAAAIGIGVALKLYSLSILGTLLIILILAGVRLFEEKFFPD